jgi:hypothetical protein
MRKNLNIRSNNKTCKNKRENKIKSFATNERGEKKTKWCYKAKKK